MKWLKEYEEKAKELYKQRKLTMISRGEYHVAFKVLGDDRVYVRYVCPKCGKTLVPARSFCPECSVDMGEWKEVSQEGEIFTWMLATEPFAGMPAQPPFIGALIRLDRTDCDFLHLVGGLDLSGPEAVKSRIKRGTRVKAVWREDKEGHILDIRYFEPI